MPLIVIDAATIISRELLWGSRCGSLAHGPGAIQAALCAVGRTEAGFLFEGANATSETHNSAFYSVFKRRMDDQFFMDDFVEFPINLQRSHIVLGF